MDKAEFIKKLKRLKQLTLKKNLNSAEKEELRILNKEILPN